MGLSYYLGMIAALPEFLDRRAWPATRRIVQIMEIIATDKGAFSDGYDAVADKILPSLW